MMILRMTRVSIFAGLLAIVMIGRAGATPVLTNGDFEANPPASLGNNIGVAVAAPWVMGGGSLANVVKVDGPGGFNYGSLGPESDASAPGAGIEQHYLDIANGANDFYQVFTPLCSGTVTYAASFSTRDNNAGEAGITILLDSDGSVAGPRQQTNLSNGTSATDPWVGVSYTTVLTANTAYRFFVDMDNNMNMDNALVQFETSCPAYGEEPEVTVLKTCNDPEWMEDGSISWACEINVDFPDGPGLDGSGQPNVISIGDTWLVDGSVIPGVSVTSSSADAWQCLDAATTTASTDSTTSLCSLQPADQPADGNSTISILTVFPNDTVGLLSNCASNKLDESGVFVPVAGSQSCVTVVVDKKTPDAPPPLSPLQCAAFEPEVTCNTVTGKPIVTLRNKYAKFFDPNRIAITSLTSGVSLTPSTDNPMSVQLTGAGQNQSVMLSTSAIETGAGSEPGLDLCCMGEIEVKIPEDFICEPTRKLEVAKTCDTDLDPAIDADADCEITVHYEGPPPSATDPITITESVTGTPWTFTTVPLSGDDWSCPPVADATPFTCTIDAGAEPSADWSNWTSTLIVQMKAGDDFENCVTVKAEGGLEDKACWSTDMPDLHVEKTASQDQCTVGAPCDFVITVTNLSTSTAYNGALTLSDTIVGSVPPIMTSSGTFTAISPSLCPISDLNAGLCTGPATIPAGGSQTYTVTWLAPMFNPGAEAESTVVTNCVGATHKGGAATVDEGPVSGQTCATVEVLPPELTVEKTGPVECRPGMPCDYQITVATGDQPFTESVLLMDDAPVGFVITAISPVPPGCGALFPATTFACVVPVSLAGNAAIQYTVSVEPATGLSSTDFLEGENCAYLRSVTKDVGLASFGLSDADITAPGAEITAVINAGGALDTSCAPVVWVPEEPHISVEKHFVQGTCSAGGPCDFNLVITNLSTTYAYNGTVALSDETTPAGYMVTGMSPPVCTPIPSQAPFQCAATVSIPAGQSQVITVTGYIPFGSVAAGTSSSLETCAVSAPVTQGSTAPWPDSLFQTTTASCAQTMVCGFACHMSEPEAEKLSVEKVLLNPETCGAGGICTYDITVTNISLVTMSSPITLQETLPAGGTLTAVRSLPWSCGTISGTTTSCVYPPIGLAAAETTSFEIDVAIPATFDGSDITNCIGFETQSGSPLGMQRVQTDPLLSLLKGGTEQDIVTYLQGRGISAEAAARMAPAFVIQSNGATRTGSGGQSCVTKSISTPEPVELSIAKQCAAPVASATGLDIDCTITVSAPSGPLPAQIEVTEELGSMLDPSDTGGGITSISSADPWVLPDVPVPFATPVTMALSGDDMPDSGTSVIDVTVHLMDAGYLVEVQNCARLQALDAGGQPIGAPQDACAGFAPGVSPVAPTVSGPVLSVEKTSLGPCSVDQIAQTYECAFALSLSNTGSAAFAGPMVLTDGFASGIVSNAVGSGPGWACELSGNGVSCINGNLSLAPGASQSVDLTLTVAGQPEGGRFENCAAIGAGTSETEQIIIVQTALTLMGVDIGSIDGQAGKRTRAAVADLQESLGLPSNGQIDSTLVQALGVPLATDATQSCVTVDLPAMPKPLLTCDKATTRSTGEACQCRYKNMYQVDKASCGCVKGTRFVAGEGCVKRTVQNPVDTTGPKAAKCDPKTTVSRGGVCECREDGMTRLSATKCARPETKAKLCPNGLPEIPGVGCIDLKLKKDSREACDPAVKKCP